MRMGDLYPLRQVNLVVSDLERSQTFYTVLAGSSGQWATRR
jgi:predicted lactoylglutathione lyase